MGYVGIDTQGARRVGQALTDAAARADEARQQAVGALTLAEVDSDIPARIGTVSDGLSALGTQVAQRADLAERFTVDPQGVAATLGAPVDQVGAALAGFVGFAVGTDLRSVLRGLPPAGQDAALDAALASLAPVLLPALRAGARPELDAGQLADLKTLALRLGIENAGPPVPAGQGHTGTEVFWNDFWADGRTVADVLADPAKLLDWVSGTFELDRRLAVATAVPGLVDVLSSLDFATAGSGVDAVEAEVAANFAAIDTWLAGFLAGVDRTPPDGTQLAQTLAFAARVGWADPGAGTASERQRFDAAVAFLTANRALGSALLPTAFEGSPQPLAFFDATGIGQLLDLGRRTGVLTDASLAGLSGATDQLAASLGIDLAASTPPGTDEATQQALQQLLGTLLASQVPAAFLQTPGLGPRFEAALSYLRGATGGADLRRRVVESVAAFRTLAVTGAPALTERQLDAVVGQPGLDALGRSRLRLRSQAAIGGSPEFLLVTQQWGVPGGHSQKIGKYKVTWSFDDTGALAAFRRKKRSWLSRAADTVKAIVHAIGDSFEDNIFKAIVQVGKIALGALALVFPGTQALGIASLALTVGDAAVKAASGDWLGALSAGLSVFTAGAGDVFSLGLASAVDGFQHEIVDQLVNPTLLGFLKDAKRAVDIGTTVVRALDSHDLVSAIGATLTAGATALGSGGQLLGSAGAFGRDVVDNLVRLGRTLGDLNGIVAPAAGLVTAIDTGNAGLALADGLSIIAGGSKALANPKGAGGTLFGFDEEVRDTLSTIAKGTGVTAFVTRAVQAADQGQAAQAISLLTQAVQAVHDPTTTILGDRVQIAQRIADVAAVIESVTDSGRNPVRAAPQAAAAILQRLQLLVDSASTPPKLAATGTVAPTAAAAAGSPARSTVVGPFAPPTTVAADPLDPADPGLPAIGFGTLRTDLPQPPRPQSGALDVGGDVLLSATVTDLPGAAPALAFDPATAGAAGKVDGLLTAGTSVPQLDLGLAGLLPLAGGGFPGPDGRQVVKVAIVGNSYMSGEGADGPGSTEQTYVPSREPIHYFDDTGYHEEYVTNPIHQSTQAGSLQAVRLLQAQFPDATVAITYSGSGRTETLAPLSGDGNGPLLQVSFVAESGATSQTILGNEALPGGSPTPQIDAVKGADIVILDTGGNDAKVADTMKSAVFKTFGDGNDDIQASIDAIPSRTANVRTVLEQIYATASPTAQVLMLGYPNVLTGIRADGTPEPLSPDVTNMTKHIDEAELARLTVYGTTLDATLAGYARGTTSLPGQSITYLPQWGHWSSEDTLGSPTAAVNDFLGATSQESYHPNLIGQRIIAGEILLPLGNAVARVLGRPAPVTVEPASHYFAMAAGAVQVGWDDPSLGYAEVPALSAPGLTAPGLSVADGSAAAATLTSPPAPPVGPSLVEEGMNPATWSSTVTNLNWDGVDLGTLPTATPPDLAVPFTPDWTPPEVPDASSYDVFSMAGSWDSGVDYSGDWSVTDTYE
jgi:hypothetical protein